MSRLEELIQELCPDGVEYKSLSCVASYSSERMDTSEITSDNYVGVDNLLPDKQGKTQSAYVPKDGRWIRYSSGDILIGNIRPYLKKIWLADREGGTNGDVLVIHRNCPEELIPKFLYYILSSDDFFLYDMQNAKGAKMPRGDKSAIMKYKIPVPPLEVQSEIVRILDSFTELTAELTVELTVELTARKQQYEYYRDKLLTFDVRTGGTQRVEWKTLGDICKLARGASPRPIKNFITEADDGINWIKIGDVPQDSKYVYSTKEKITPEGASKSRYVKSGDFILSNSMSFGRPYILKTDGCIHDGWLSISGFEEYVLSDYLYYVLVSSPVQREMAQKASFGGAVQNLNTDIVSKICIPIPPKGMQKRIVNILDNFDSICSDLTSGLPAEIEARQKQYEYYRDKLLTFKEKTS